jgi:hypothetical protein
MSSWQAFIRPGDLVFQVGAGAADGAVIETLLGLGARVVGVEADPTRARARRARFGPAREAPTGGLLGSDGAGGRAGAVIVDMGLANRTTRLETNRPGVVIEITTLGELIRAFGMPRYCRLDVGGDPESILAGLADAPAPAIALLSFEFKAARIESLRRAIDRLQRLGYRQFNWGRAPGVELVAAAWSDARAVVDQITREAGAARGATLRGEVFARGEEVARVARARFAVSILRQPGNIHSECFRELAETVNGGLNELGHDSVLSEETAAAGRRNIVFGSNLIANLDRPVVFAPGSILYNLEQIYDGSPWLTADLLAAFRAHAVWDYSRANIDALARHGIAAQHVPVGYLPSLTRIPPAPAQDIDVLFVGSIAERRLQILQALERQGARVVAIYGRYGAERDAFIARAKIILNIHFHAAKVFEIVRVSYLLANRCFVVSETGSDAATEASFASGVAFCAYERLVDTCVAYLRDPASRAQVAARGLALMSSLGEADFLRPVVGDPRVIGDARAP